MVQATVRETWKLQIKETGNSKWIKLKTLGSTRSSYTHTSSKKYPIIVGQKYQYTVKAYNRDTKKYGSYNTKGLTVTASLKMVTGIEAKYISATFSGMSQARRTDASR